jgi:hypothetical protein
MHVHVAREALACKFWLDPLSLATNAGFAAHELNRIRGIIRDHLGVMKHAWSKHCGSA